MSKPTRITAYVDDTRPGEGVRRYRLAVLVPYGEHGMMMEAPRLTRAKLEARVRAGTSDIDSYRRYMESQLQDPADVDRLPLCEEGAGSFRAIGPRDRANVDSSPR